jgi:hypothetical protein
MGIGEMVSVSRGTPDPISALIMQPILGGNQRRFEGSFIPDFRTSAMLLYQTSLPGNQVALVQKNHLMRPRPRWVSSPGPSASRARSPLRRINTRSAICRMRSLRSASAAERTTSARELDLVANFKVHQFQHVPRQNYGRRIANGTDLFA